MRFDSINGPITSEFIFASGAAVNPNRGLHVLLVNASEAVDRGWDLPSLLSAPTCLVRAGPIVHTKTGGLRGNGQVL